MKEKIVFVDTGAWFALADKSDHYHNRAVQIYPELLNKYRQLMTTNLVVAETYLLIRRALDWRSAITFLENVSASPRIARIYSEQSTEDSAEEILRRYQDQDFSFTDAVSFAVMGRFHIQEAFAFDQHFATAGFTLIQ